MDELDQRVIEAAHEVLSFEETTPGSQSPSTLAIAREVLTQTSSSVQNFCSSLFAKQLSNVTTKTAGGSFQAIPQVLGTFLGRLLGRIHNLIDGFEVLRNCPIVWRFQRLSS